MDFDTLAFLRRHDINPATAAIRSFEMRQGDTGVTAKATVDVPGYDPRGRRLPESPDVTRLTITDTQPYG